MKKFLQKLKTILHSKFFYIIIFIILIVYCFYYFYHPKTSNISLTETQFIGIISNYKIDKDLLTIEVKGSEKIIGYYYFNSESEMLDFSNKYNLGDKITLSGSFSISKNNTVPNLFNYKKYLQGKHIYLIMNIDKIIKLEDNHNLFYEIKNTINKHINSYKSKVYLEMFILGDKSMLDDTILTTYQSNGISHLFAISGMHVSLLGGLFLIVLKQIRIGENKSLIITSLFLLFYMCLSGLSASVSRSVILFTLYAINIK